MGQTSGMGIGPEGVGCTVYVGYHGLVWPCHAMRIGLWTSEEFFSTDPASAALYALDQNWVGVFFNPFPYSNALSSTDIGVTLCYRDKV